MTLELVLPLVFVAGAASGPLLDRAIATAVRSHGARPSSVRGMRRCFRSISLAAAVAALEVGAALRLGATWTLLPVAVFLAGVVALAWCDGQYFLLPKRIQHPTTATSAAFLLLAAAMGGRWHELLVALICGAVGFGVFLVMNVANPRAMAFGDVRLAGTIGLVVGWFGVTRAFGAFAVASVAAALVALVLLGTRRITLRSHLPYGVFLAIGAIVAILA